MTSQNGCLPYTFFHVSFNNSSSGCLLNFKPVGKHDLAVPYPRKLVWQSCHKKKWVFILCVFHIFIDNSFSIHFSNFKLMDKYDLVVLYHLDSVLQNTYMTVLLLSLLKLLCLPPCLCFKKCVRL